MGKLTPDRKGKPNASMRATWKAGRTEEYYVTHMGACRKAWTVNEKLAEYPYKISNAVLCERRGRHPHGFVVAIADYFISRKIKDNISLIDSASRAGLIGKAEERGT